MRLVATMLLPHNQQVSHNDQESFAPAQSYFELPPSRSALLKNVLCACPLTYQLQCHDPTVGGPTNCTSEQILREGPSGRHQTHFRRSNGALNFPGLDHILGCVAILHLHLRGDPKLVTGNSTLADSLDQTPPERPRVSTGRIRAYQQIEKPKGFPRKLNPWVGVLRMFVSKGEWAETWPWVYK